MSLLLLLLLLQPLLEPLSCSLFVRMEK